MLSDELHDALVEIERYQREMPDAYDPLTREIEVVKAVMDAFRICLDAAPGISKKQDRLVADLRNAIRSLDVSEVRAARQRFLAWVEQTRRRGKLSPDSTVLSESEDGHSELYERLMHIEIPTSLDCHEVVDCFLRATMVAAGIRFDNELFQSVQRLLATKSTSVLSGRAKGEEP